MASFICWMLKSKAAMVYDLFFIFFNGERYQAITQPFSTIQRRNNYSEHLETWLKFQPPTEILDLVIRELRLIKYRVKNFFFK